MKRKLTGKYAREELPSSALCAYIQCHNRVSRGYSRDGRCWLHTFDERVRVRLARKRRERHQVPADLDAYLSAVIDRHIGRG